MRYYACKVADTRVLTVTLAGEGLNLGTLRGDDNDVELQATSVQQRLNSLTMASGAKSINLDDCTPQQLEQLHQGMTQELQMLTSSMGTLKLAMNKYKFSKDAIDSLKVAKDESTSLYLLPITTSRFMLCIFISSFASRSACSHFSTVALFAFLPFSLSAPNHFSPLFAFAAKNTLIPLTSSLYIPGKIKSVQSALVDIGTGYFVEKSLDGAAEYFEVRLDSCSPRFTLHFKFSTLFT